MTPNDSPEKPTLEELLASMAGIELYRVDMRPNASFRPTLDPPLYEHLLWLREQEQAGRLVFSGPINFGEGWDGTGMSIFRGESQAEVEAILAQEPYQVAGLRTNVVSRWQVNEGSLTVRVNLLSKRGSLL